MGSISKKDIRILKLGDPNFEQTAGEIFEIVESGTAVHCFINGQLVKVYLKNNKIEIDLIESEPSKPLGYK